MSVDNPLPMFDRQPLEYRRRPWGRDNALHWRVARAGGCRTRPHRVPRAGMSQDLCNSPTLRDQHGNTALHLAVMHDAPAMYSYFLELEARARPSPAAHGRAFHHRRNADLLTPLALAAALGRERMFAAILHGRVLVQWEYGPFACQLVPLEGLEQPLLEPGEEGLVRCRREPTALECICAGRDVPLASCLVADDGAVPDDVLDGRLRLAALPEVRALLDRKWRAFGAAKYRRQVFGCGRPRRSVWGGRRAGGGLPEPRGALGGGGAREGGATQAAPGAAKGRNTWSGGERACASPAPAVGL